MSYMPQSAVPFDDYQITGVAQTPSYMPSSAVPFQNMPEQMGNLSPTQAEAGYVLNSFNNIPGMNLIKEIGAAVRGAGAGISDPSNFGQAFENEYNSSRENQKKLMYNEAQQFPTPNTVGQVGAGLSSLGYLPFAGPQGTIAGDALMGSVEGSGYGAASNFGAASGTNDRFQGALSGAVQGARTGLGAGLLAGGINKAVNGAKSLYRPSVVDAANTAIENNIPVYKSDLSPSKALNYLSTASNEIPSFIGGTSGRIPSQQEALAAALGKTIGNPDTTEISKNVVDKALADSGQKIGDLVSQYDVPINQTHLDTLDDLANQANKRLTGDNLDTFNKTIQNIKDEIINNASGQASSGTGILPGEKYQQLRTAMNEDIQNNQFGSTAPVAKFTRQARNVMDDAFQSQMLPEDALSLQKSRAIYGNASDLSPLTESKPLGDFPATAIQAKTVGNPALEPLGEAGQLMRMKVGNSPTTEKAIIAKLAGVLGGGAAAIGGAHTLDPDWGHDAALTLGTALIGGGAIGGANRLLNPRMTSAGLNGYQALQPISPYANQLADLLRRLPVASGTISNVGGK